MLRALARSLALKPKDTRAQHAMLLKLLSLNPKDPHVLRCLGDIMYQRRVADSSDDPLAMVALGYYLRGASEGDSICQLNAGNCYFYGIGSPKAPKKALHMYKRSAASKNALAQRAMGYFYRSVGNFTKSMKMYLMAAENGDVHTQVALADWYYGQEDYRNAVRWYNRASLSCVASEERSAARNALGICFAKGLGVQKSLEQAKRMFTEAARDGNAHARVNLKSVPIFQG